MFVWLSSTPKLALYFLSGILLGVGFVWSQLWILVFLGIFLYLLILSRTESLKPVLLGSFITFTVKTLFATSVFWSVYPITWLELDLGLWELPIIGLYWISISAFIGLGGVVGGFLIWFAHQKVQVAFFAILLPFIFIASEIFGSLMFSILTYGEGGSINTAYSLGYIGYLLGEHNWLVQTAVFGGVYILTALAVLLGFLFWLLYEQTSRKIFFYISVAVLVVLYSTANVPILETETGNNHKTTIAIVDTEFVGDFHKMENHKEYKREQILEAVAFALKLEPDYVLLPENSEFNNLNLVAKGAYDLFRFQYGNPSVVLIDSGAAFLSSDKTAVVRATIYDGINKTGWAVDKQYLVPQGEFMPHVYLGALNILGRESTLKNIEAKLYFRPGPLASQVELPAVIPAVLFCFESVDPYGVRRLLKARPDIPFVAHPISHAWFHQSEALHRQLDTMLKIQAIWNQTTIISAGNMASGLMYTKKGKTVVPAEVGVGERWRVSLVSL